MEQCAAYDLYLAVPDLEARIPAGGRAPGTWPAFLRAAVAGYAYQCSRAAKLLKVLQRGAETRIASPAAPFPRSLTPPALRSSFLPRASHAPNPPGVGRRAKTKIASPDFPPDFPRHATIRTRTGKPRNGTCRSLPHRAASRLYPFLSTISSPVPLSPRFSSRYSGDCSYDGSLQKTRSFMRHSWRLARCGCR